MHRSHTSRPIRRERGMSLIELCVVVSIMLILAALVMPRVSSVMAETRLRGSASEVASLLQQARMRAVRTNTFVTVRYAPLVGNANVAYVDSLNLLGNPGDGSGDGQYNANAAPGTREAVVSLGQGIRFLAAGNPAFPAANVDSGGQLTQNDGTPLRISWSARGLPCAPAGAVCQNAAAYAYFLTDGNPDQPGGTDTNRWAAVTVSRSGRIKVWMWTGVAWQ
jgi:prepilin-type N-terminal cleavage/methylation domain-containing protein